MRGAGSASAAGPEHGPAAAPSSGEETSWADLRPRPSCRWSEEEGRVALLRPRFGRGWLGRRLQAAFRPRPYRVLLDDVGTFIWRRCDGGTRVEEIARAMRAEFGERVEPVEERLVTFLQSLVRGRFLEVSGPDR